MLLYKRYLLHKIIGYFLAIATILICLIWFTRAISFVKYITDKGISIASFLYLFVLILPWLSLLIIPISLFIAILTCYARMNANNELTILKNSGLNKVDLARPAVFVGVILTFFCYFISFYLMPVANKNLRMARKDFQNNYTNIMISPGIFESFNSLTIYVNQRDANNKLFGILLYDNLNEKNSLTLTAKSGDLIEENGAVLMRLYQGTLQKYNFEKRNSEILNFESYVVNLNENKEIDVGQVWKAQERDIYELLNPNDLDPTDEDYDQILGRIKVEIHKRITYPLFSLIFAMIAVAYIMRGQFNRRSGSLANNVKATIAVVTFITINMVSYDLMEISMNYIILLYGNFIFFLLFSVYLLKGNYQKIHHLQFGLKSDGNNKIK